LPSGRADHAFHVLRGQGADPAASDALDGLRLDAEKGTGLWRWWRLRRATDAGRTKRRAGSWPRPLSRAWPCATWRGATGWRRTPGLAETFLGMLSLASARYWLKFVHAA